MPGVHEIQVTLKKYEFNPGTLRDKKGERVRLILDAADHDHGFKLNEFDVNQKVQKGTTATVEFIADKAGTFQFRCSSVCGLDHRGRERWSWKSEPELRARRRGYSAAILAVNVEHCPVTSGFTPTWLLTPLQL